LPPASIEQLIGLLDAELPARVGRHERRRPVEEVRSDLSLAPVDMRLDGPAVDEQSEGRPDSRIGQEGMHGRDARALAVDIGPRVALVELDVHGIGGPAPDDAALAALLHTAQDVVLDRHAPGVVVLPGLEYGTGGRG